MINSLVTSSESLRVRLGTRYSNDKHCQDMLCLTKRFTNVIRIATAERRRLSFRTKSSVIGKIREKDKRNKFESTRFLFSEYSDP